MKRAALFFAVALAAPSTVLADISPSSVPNPQTFVISTSGATALGALTRGATTNAQNNPTGEQNGLWRLGVNNYQIGRSTYSFGASTPVQQYVSYRANSPIAGENTVRQSDHIVYQYSEVGSVNGVLNTVKSGGIFIPNGLGNQIGPGVPSQSAPLWINGWKQINNTQFQVDGPGTVSSLGGGTWTPYAGNQAALAQGGGQVPNRIGYTDVRSFQAFAFNDVTSAAPSPERRPRDVGSTSVDDRAGYGLGIRAFNPLTGDRGTNFAKLANRTVIAGETDNPNDSHIRNETLAIVPFAVAANPGTGLARLEEIDVKWLNGVGRLRNGANFNSVTREIGSGTRNQGANNLNIDPSWASGERDRRSLASSNLTQYTDSNGVVRNIVDADGNPVTVRPGDEIDPRLDLFGVDSGLAASEQPKEHRVGPLMRFGDKNSGGSGVRPVVVSNRMAITPNLSVGDVGDRGITGSGNSLTNPMRVLGVKWNFAPGEAGANSDYTQPTAVDVATGRYQQWSAAQAVSIIGVDTNGDGFAESLGTVGTDTNPDKPIFNDQIDFVGSKGLHRNWLNNITGSVSTFGQAVTNVTPADAVIAAGFFPEQLMRNTKVFDGGIQSERTLSNVDPDGPGPGISEQELYNRVVASTASGTLGARLNWADPETITGDLTNNTYLYRIFTRDRGNTDTAGTVAIPITTRTSLAGDMNNDGVRDLADTQSLALAYVSSAVAPAINSGGALSTTNITFGPETLSVGNLIVLTDFNGDGNVSGTNASPTFEAVDRDDVIFFLLGATVDTTSYVNADTGATVSSPTAAQRRTDGVRWGRLRKNAAIDTFNDTIQSRVTAGQITQTEADSLKYFKGDANNDGVYNRADARLVDQLVGTAPYSLSLEQVMTQYSTDPIYAEFTDDNLISHVDPDGVGPGKSDMQIVVERLQAFSPSRLITGDNDFSGGVTVADVARARSNFNQSDRKWSTGDMNFNGVVTVTDIALTRSNLGQVAPLQAGGGLVAPEPGVPNNNSPDLVYDPSTGTVLLDTEGVTIGVYFIASDNAFDVAPGKVTLPLVNGTVGNTTVTPAEIGQDFVTGGLNGLFTLGTFVPANLDLTSFRNLIIDSLWVGVPSGSAVFGARLVPEPATMLAVAGAGTALLIRRRKQA